MIKEFGAPYMGSKSRIALDILKRLPPGKRFVDLFGGGFAVSHAAALTNKWGSVLYNDINPLITDLIKRAIGGEFNYENFKPKWISRDEFNLNKDKDGYIKYIWSFGNKGEGYLYGEDVAPLKKLAHNLIVFGVKDKWFDVNCPGIYKHINSNNIHVRRLQLYRYFRGEIKKQLRTQQLQHLEMFKRSQHLERLDRLQRLDGIDRSLKITNISYDKYEYREGDVVYLDPPYNGTIDYGVKFDHKAFYDWCYSRPYQVWFSSYEIPDKRFKLVYAAQLFSRLSREGDRRLAYERLYTNK